MSPRWEARLLQFLETSGAECVVDEEERQTMWLDGWEAEQRVAEQPYDPISSLSPFFYPYPKPPAVHTEQR